MNGENSSGSALEVTPLTPRRWPDLEALFGPERGAHAGCWCQWWRLSTSEFGSTPREHRKAALREDLRSGACLGVLAYRDGAPIGWAAVGPRTDLPKLNRSRVARSLTDDHQDVWMINCFFIDRHHRLSGVMSELIKGAVRYARTQGARAVEACPIEPHRPLQWGEGFVGIASVFRAAGFEEVARRSPTRPLMRLELGTG